MAALALGACGDGGDAAGGSGDVVEPPTASATIGPAGGTLDGPDGVRVEVPAGALTQDTVIRVTKTAAGAPGTLPNGLAPAPAYEFTPHGIDFNLPVTISLPTPAGDPAQQQVFMASPGDSSWRGVGSASDGGRTAWQVLGFSWALMGAACYPVPGDPFTCQWPRTNGFLSATPSSALVFVDRAIEIPSYRLTTAGTVEVRFDYSGAGDCAATVAMRRWRPSVRDASGRIVVSTLLAEQAAALTLSGARASGQTTAPPIAFTSSDNGEHFFGMGFSCLRAGQTTPMRYGGQIRLTVDIPASTLAAPAVTASPTDVSVQEPAGATFSVAGTGLPTPTVQWQRSDNGGASWVDIAGATALAYTSATTSVASDSGSQYRAVLTNSQGAATSQAATLTVTAPATGQTVVVAGAIGSAGLVNEPGGPGSAARLGGPTWLARDAAGNLYVSEDRNLDIRKITPQGAVTTLATGRSGLVGPKGLAVATDGTVYVADGDEIKTITPDGVVSVLAGLRDSDLLQPVRFSQPTGLAINGIYLFVADTNNYAIKRIDLSTRTVYTVAEGSPGLNLPTDGCSGVTLTRPIGIAVEADSGYIYWTEENNTVRFKGECVSTLAGLPRALGGYADGVGSEALFDAPAQLTVDPRGDLYVADYQNSVLRKIAMRGAGRPGVVTTVFGVAGDARTIAGPNGRIAYPLGVLFRSSQTLWATSNDSHVVLQVELPE